MSSRRDTRPALLVVAAPPTLENSRSSQFPSLLFSPTSHHHTTQHHTQCCVTAMAEKKTSTSSPGPSSEGTLNVPSTPTITMGVEFEFLFGYLSLEEARKFDHADDDEDAGDDESVGGGDDDDKDDDEDSPTLGTATTPAEKKKAVVSAGEGSASFSSSARRGEIAAEADPWGDPSLAGQLCEYSSTSLCLCYHLVFLDFFSNPLLSLISFQERPLMVIWEFSYYLGSP